MPDRGRVLRPLVAWPRGDACFQPARPRIPVGEPFTVSLDHPPRQTEPIRDISPARVVRLDHLQTAIEEVPRDPAAVPKKAVDRLIRSLEVGGAAPPMPEQMRNVALVGEPSSCATGVNNFSKKSPRQ